MNQIILRDKIIYIAQNTYEIKRLKGKWLQSFLELVLVRSILATIILMVLCFLLMSLMQITIEFFHFTGFIGGGLFILTIFFLDYYKDINIPIEKIKNTYINTNNQLVVSYMNKKREVNKTINLPKALSERKSVINKLKIEGIIKNDIQEIPHDSERRMHKMNLYMGITGVFISLVFYIVLFHISINKWALAVNSIILLFCIVSMIFSAYKLLKMPHYEK